jgi:hypothetical protein
VLCDVRVLRKGRAQSLLLLLLLLLLLQWRRQVRLLHLLLHWWRLRLQLLLRRCLLHLPLLQLLDRA